MEQYLLKQRKIRFVYLPIELLLFILAFVVIINGNSITGALLLVIAFIYSYWSIFRTVYANNAALCWTYLSSHDKMDTISDLPDHKPTKKDFIDTSAYRAAFPESLVICGKQAFCVALKGLLVLPYDAAVWVYPETIKGGLTPAAQALVIRTDDGQKFFVRLKSDAVDPLIAMFREANPQLLVGNSEVNKELYDSRVQGAKADL